MTQIAITDIGLCTPLGDNAPQVLAHLLDGDSSAMSWDHELLPEASALVGQINTELAQIPDHLSLFSCRNNRLLLTAAKQIAAKVAWAKEHYGSSRIGVIIGTCTSGIANGEQALEYFQSQGHFPENFDYQQQEWNCPSEFLRRYFELSGPCYAILTACSSSIKVFASAKRLLQADLCDMVIVGGFDSLSRLPINGFYALESVSKGQLNPFSNNRDGINVGEGGALFTLEKVSSESAQQSVILASIGESSDAYHISAPHPQGRGAIAAMEDALTQASLKADAIDYLNLHGTGTQQNDAMESRALHSVFGHNLPPCSSTKPLTGHTLGASGAIETAFCYLLLSKYNSQQGLPPHIWDGEQDPANPPLPFVVKGQRARLVHVMNNSFAFGGSNACMILSRRHEE